MPRNSCLAAVALAAVAFVAPIGAAEVSYQDLLNAGGNTRDWLSYGRTYDAQRYVPLTQITPQNVQRLHPVWVFATGGDNRGLEATPLVHDGVIYLSADQSRLFAVDARTGMPKWRYDPKIAKDVEQIGRAHV